MLLSVESGEHLGNVAVLRVYVIVFLFRTLGAEEEAEREGNRGKRKRTVKTTEDMTEGLVLRCYC